MTSSMQTILVTGGAGFIGSCYVQRHFEAEDAHIVTLDKLTYAGHQESLPEEVAGRHKFVRGDIGDQTLTSELLAQWKPTAIVNFAAESHVDRSIDGPAEFVNTNVVGTCSLLETALAYYKTLSSAEQQKFRFLHVSTDEVFGSLGETGKFLETTPYAPNSPYSASKAASDMFVRAYGHTYGLPVLITNCSNNYGPRQYPEKLIPLVLMNALEGKPLPIYGDGLNIRDWLFVEDHCAAIDAVLERGRLGETYNVGGDSERDNLTVVHTICDLVDELVGPEKPCRELITFVRDRPGHDRRYAIDATKLKTELGWKPTVTFEEGLRRTVLWYLENMEWVSAVSAGKYGRERIGLGV